LKRKKNSKALLSLRKGEEGWEVGGRLVKLRKAELYSSLASANLG
jgi:hypothetical protein